jgi:hypothetical protein
VRSRKLELEHFLNQRGVEISLKETFLRLGQAFRLANHVCTAQTDQQLGAAQPYWSAMA